MGDHLGSLVVNRKYLVRVFISSSQYNMLKAAGRGRENAEGIAVKLKKLDTMGLWRFLLGK